MNTEGDSRSTSPLKAEPERIDFGCLEPGEEASTILKVTGGPSKVVASNDQLKVTPLSIDSENNELQVMLLGGSAGELIWDNIVLQGEKDELEVLVTARWEEHPLQISSSLGDKVTTFPSGGGEVTTPSPSALPPVRTFKGRKCWVCGRNIRYDSKTGIWLEHKNCKGIRAIGPFIMRSYREVYEGRKDLVSYLKELWNIIIGKEKW